MQGDPNNFEYFTSWLLAGPVVWLGWLVKSLLRNQRETEKDLSAHKLYAANNFVKHHDLKETEKRILNAIGDLKDDLKTKADK